MSITRTALAAALSLYLGMPGTALSQTTDAAESRRHPGEILDLSTMQTLSPEDLYIKLGHKKVILIGEQHDNPEHHAVETLLFEELVTPGTAVVFEMLGSDLPLDELGITTSTGELEAALKPVIQAWDWDTYGRLYRNVLQLGGHLVGGNLNQAQIKAIYQGQADGLPAREQKTRSGVAATVRERIANEISAQHCEPVPAQRLDSMVEIQLARDARMAAQLDQHAGNKTTLLVAGEYHVRKDLGVPRHLERDDISVILLTSVQDSGEVAGGDELVSNQVADYLWFTSAIGDKDYCGDAAIGASQATPSPN
jgi:uncharacterized iron-regulated protein